MVTLHTMGWYSILVLLCFLSKAVYTSYFSRFLTPKLSTIDTAEHTMPRADAVVKSILRIERRSPLSVFVITDSLTVSSPDISKALSGEVADFGIGRFDISLSDLQKFNVTLAANIQKIKDGRQFRKSSWNAVVVVMSDDMTFLELFGVAAKNGRVLSGTTRLLVITNLTLKQISWLMDNNWTYAMMNSMFVNLESNANNIRYGIYTHLPYTPEGSTKVLRVASWSTQRGLLLFSVVKIFPDKYSNFYGSRVNVTALPFPPYWDTVEEKAMNGTVRQKHSGCDYQMIDAIAKALNFSLYVLPTENWDEVTLRVEERQSFVASIVYAVFPKRMERYDYSYMFEYAFHAFTMAKPALMPQWHSLYYPFANSVWFFILAVVFFLPLPFMLVSRGISNILSSKKSSYLPVRDIVLQIAGTLLGQPLQDRLPARYSSRLLIISWLFFTFIVGIAYRGNLTAYMTAPKYHPKVETLHELVSSGARVTMPPYGEHFRDYFKGSDSSDYKTLGERVDIVPTAPIGVQQASERKQAHMEASRYLKLLIAEKFTQADGSTSLYIGRESVFPGLSAWPIPHDAPFKLSLDRAIMAIIEGGLYEKWSKDFIEKVRQEGAKKKKEFQQQQIAEGKRPEEINLGAEGSTTLTIVHMQGPLLLLLIGLVIAGLIFFLEVLVPRCRPGT